MIAKKILQTGGVQILILILGVITGIFITRLLGPEGRGIYTLFKANIDFILLFLTFGIGSSITYYVSNKRIPFSKMAGIAMVSLFLGILGIGLLFSLIYYAFPGIFHHVFPSGYDDLFFLLYVFFSFVFGFLNLLLSGFLIGEKYFTDNNIIGILHSALLLVAIATFFYSVDYMSVAENIRFIFLITCLFMGVNFLFRFYTFIRRFKKSMSISFKIKSELITTIGFIYLVYIGELINFLNYRLDIWLVEYYTNVYQLGLYSVAVGVSQVMWLIATPITLVLLPYLNSAQKTKLEAKDLFFFYAKITFSLTLGASLILLIFGNTLLPFIYGEEFSSSVPSLNILLPGILFSSLTKIFSVYIVTQSKIIYNVIAVSVGVVVTIVLDILLIPNFGIIGASIATSFSYFTIFMVSFYILRQKLNLRQINYFVLNRTDIGHILRRIKQNDT